MVSFKILKPRTGDSIAPWQQASVWDRRSLRLEDPRKEGSFADIGGVKVFYRSAGTGEPIILLHGFPSSSYDWRELLVPLSKFGRVIGPDLYGFGYSEPKQVDLLSFLPDFVEAMSIDHFTFVGYDAGGVYGLVYALQNPAAVTRLNAFLREFLDSSGTSRGEDGSNTSPDLIL